MWYHTGLMCVATILGNPFGSRYLLILNINKIKHRVLLAFGIALYIIGHSNVQTLPDEESY
ncbi:hypothetical protein SPSYN_02132 [Sporotomaculum syntrophicum]|uniref:Uncharacterized protein n=1 Tax=Sporotomaculum syntrophicum TaxID=182264 RepID=A0A9D3AXE6_9FIRM|nr:hypothetical protein SPSYN_02132 [Sporotomaculum syntrophicum]